MVILSLVIFSGCSETRQDQTLEVDNRSASIKAENPKSESVRTKSVKTESTKTESRKADKQKVDAPDKSTKKAEAPLSWQEQFVQKYTGGNPLAPAYEKFWTDVEKVGHDVVNAPGKTGGASKEELARDIENGTYRGDQAQVAGAIYDTFDQIKSPGRLKRMLFTTKIEAADISSTMSKIKSGEARFHDVDDLTFWADNQHNLQRFSSDGSGAVSYKDLTSALERKDLSAEDRFNLQALESKFHAIAPDGKLGKSDIDAYYNNFVNNDSDYKLGKQFMHDMRHIADSQNDVNSKKLFADQANPIESIKVDNVTQGFAGNCAFKASLAAVVATKPETVLNMVHETGPKALQIDFPGKVEKPFNIKPPTDEEIGLYSWQANRGSWASALEKGYGERVFATTGNKSLVDKVDADRAAADGYTQHALQVLTGHEVAQMDLGGMNASQVRSTLEAAQRDKRALVLNTAPGDQSAKTEDGFAIDHAFTILGINSSGEVTVRDPRANGQNRPDGVMQISVAKLKSNFKMLYVETEAPLG